MYVFCKGIVMKIITLTHTNWQIKHKILFEYFIIKYLNTCDLSQLVIHRIYRNIGRIFMYDYTQTFLVLGRNKVVKFLDLLV